MMPAPTLPPVQRDPRFAELDQLIAAEPTEAARLYLQGLTLREVGKRQGRSAMAVLEEIERQGVPRRRRGPKGGPRLQLTPWQRKVHDAARSRRNARKRLGIPPERWRLKEEACL